MFRHLRSRKDGASTSERSKEVAVMPPHEIGADSEPERGSSKDALLSSGIASVVDGGSSQVPRRRRSVSELPLNLRRFLLVPEPDGSEPPRLQGFDLLLSPVMYSFLLHPCEGSAAAQVAAARNNILTYCELMALLSGFMLSVPLSLRTSIGEHRRDWETASVSVLVLDTLAAFTTCALILGILTNVIASVWSLLISELNGLLELMKLGMVSIFFFFFGMFLGGTVIAVHTFHSVGHRGPAIGVCVSLVLGFLILIRILFPLFPSCLPLEMLHVPCYVRFLCMLMGLLVRPLGPYHFCGDLEAKYGEAARLRAAKLLRDAGFEPPPPGRPGQLDP